MTDIMKKARYPDRRQLAWTPAKGGHRERRNFEV